MTAASSLFAARYAAALASYLDLRSEAALSQAYELGRQALNDGVGVVDMAMLHHRALRTRFDQSPADPDGTMERAAEFLAEGLSAFEMSLRGYRDANADLKKLNAALRQSQAALEMANRALEESVRLRSGQLSETEMELKRTRSFLDLVVENIPGILIVKSAKDHRHVLINRTAEEVLGYDRKEVIGKTDHDLFPKEQADFFVARDKEMLLSRTLQMIPEEPITTREKQIRYLRVKKLPICGENGEPDYILALAEDITERRQIETQLVQAQKMEAIGNLTGGMAHDFNNLLGVVIGNLDLLRDLKKDDKDVEELAGEALDAASRGADLIRRLLAFARRQPLRPQRIDINGLIDGIARLLRRTLGEHIQMTVDLAPGVWPAVVDPAQLEASLTNLGTNARDAMPKGGSLVILTGNRRLDADYAAQHDEVTPGDYAMIEVSDTGMGMPPEVASRVFEPFFTTKERGKGTGLGLSMVFGFLKQSGGHVNVYSEVGVGTTFRLYLPRAAEEVAAEAQEAPGSLAPGRGETVLAVEDNTGLRRIVVRQLRELGYCVLAAETAADAMAMLEQGAVDVLFTDIVMPGEMNGLELARMVLERCPRTRVVLTSGFPDVKINGNLDKTVKARLLSKPYRKEDLARILREVLDA